MEENKTVETKVEEKKEVKEGLLAKTKNFMKNPAKGRPIKNAGWMLGGAGLLMLIATLAAGKGKTEDDSDDEYEE